MYFEVDGQRTFAYTGAREAVAGQPAILFVHGGGLEHSVWVLQSRYFAHHGYNVLAIDLPGHGCSQGEAPSRIEDMADWCVRALDALAIPDTAMVGHSMGSLVTLETAARHPQRVWHAALLGTSVPMPVTDELLGAAAANEHAAFDMINIWGHAVASQIGGNRAPGMWMTGATVRLLERSRPGVLHKDLAACASYGNGLEAATRIRCPVHVLLGAEDMMAAPKRAQAVIGALTDARVTVLAGCGHMLMSERPDETLDALLDSVRAATPAG